MWRKMINVTRNLHKKNAQPPVVYVSNPKYHNILWSSWTLRYTYLWRISGDGGDSATEAPAEATTAPDADGKHYKTIYSSEQP